MLLRYRQYATVIAVLLVALGLSQSAEAARCLYVSSYHHGYAWNDGIERGITQVLKDRCTLDYFYMDTKRNKGEAFARSAGLKAKAYIEKTAPDIVIAADDNASRYLIKPFFRDAALPVIFCGINHTIEPYGYPYRNTTGMIEISPVKPLLKYIQHARSVHQAIFLAADVPTQHKEFDLNKEVYQERGIAIEPVFVRNMHDWLAAYRDAAGKTDLLVLGNSSGISDWDDNRAMEAALSLTGMATVTNYEWMSRYAVLSLIKLPEEQGEWAAEAALAVLDGIAIETIPVVVNRRWKAIINTTLLQRNKISLPQAVMLKASRLSLP